MHRNHYPDPHGTWQELLRSLLMLQARARSCRELLTSRSEVGELQRRASLSRGCKRLWSLPLLGRVQPALHCRFTVACERHRHLAYGLLWIPFLNLIPGTAF